ncbi:MAG: flagellar biosynthesis protein [Phenylobacterium sp.]|jgi:flagellar biosynthesis protein
MKIDDQDSQDDKARVEQNLTKANKTAVGLSYDGGKGAPKVVSKGHGALAEEIIAIAQEHGVLVHEDQQLTQLLATLDLGEDIPKQLYVLIAELIAFSYVLQGKFPDNWDNTHKRIDFKA